MENKAKNFSFLFRIIRWLVNLFYPKTEVEGVENLPDEPVIIVGNHAQMHGPIVCELYLPESCYTWCAGEMMHLRDVPAYAYKDFWSHKPVYMRWFFKILSYIIAPLSVVIFNNARTIKVYRDSRILSTFHDTVSKLQCGCNIVIFPEHDVPHNTIINDFQSRFIDISKPYYRKTGQELSFVPMYIAPDLRKIYLGKPVRFCAENQFDSERQCIRNHLMNEITAIAQALPQHTVVPYSNIPKKDYPHNK